MDVEMDVASERHAMLIKVKARSTASPLINSRSRLRRCKPHGSFVIAHVLSAVLITLRWRFNLFSGGIVCLENTKLQA